MTEYEARLAVTSLSFLAGACLSAGSAASLPYPLRRHVARILLCVSGVAAALAFSVWFVCL